jgi:hypothetical protein
MMEKLCIFCKHFRWTKEEMWGMGSEYTGPMFEGGWAECGRRRFANLEMPRDESDYRRVILHGVSCPDFESVGGEG